LPDSIRKVHTALRHACLRISSQEISPHKMQQAPRLLDFGCAAGGVPTILGHWHLNNWKRLHHLHLQKLQSFMYSCLGNKILKVRATVCVVPLQMFPQLLSGSSRRLTSHRTARLPSLICYPKLLGSCRSVLQGRSRAGRKNARGGRRCHTGLCHRPPGRSTKQIFHSPTISGLPPQLFQTRNPFTP
jgi:hypothetical protein